MFSSSASQVSSDANFIEEVFSTWLYTGNGSTQTITNGVDLAGKGGLTWIKQRTLTRNHNLFDTTRGATKALFSDSTSGQITGTTTLTSFNANGFSLGDDSDIFGVNLSAQTYVSWTFRKQPKFFDVVTYTGNGVDGRFINHTLTSTPGAVFIKRTDTTSNWTATCRTNTGQAYLRLNSTAAAEPSTGGINTNGYCGYVDNTTFGVYAGATDISAVNASGGTYVAYLFAHNAGGFGLTGTDNVISCGSFTGSNNLQVTLGWEPQFIIAKRTDSSENGDWFISDNMRGWNVGGSPRERFLLANSSVSESLDSGGPNPYSNCDSWQPNATGFQLTGFPLTSGNFIYIAIRRGPMKVPTTGTSVYNAQVATGGSLPRYVSGFPVDMVINGDPVNAGADKNTGARLLGTQTLATNTTAAEASSGSYTFDYNNGYFSAVSPRVSWMFQRAPGYMDVVCWSGNGTGAARNHNLTVYPELVISKLCNGGAGFGAWGVQNNINPSAKQTGVLNTTAAFSSSGATSPTAIVFYPSDDQSGANYVTYLFASCPGVSKVGTFTGTGATQVINCGFTGGARFVMIKRTDSTGDWYVWDTARGIVSGNDPRLSLNTTAAEVTTDDSVDTDSTGFVVNQLSATNINVTSATYIYLAIA